MDLSLVTTSCSPTVSFKSKYDFQSSPVSLIIQLQSPLVAPIAFDPAASTSFSSSPSQVHYHYFFHQDYSLHSLSQTSSSDVLPMSHHSPPRNLPTSPPTRHSMITRSKTGIF